VPHASQYKKGCNLYSKKAAFRVKQEKYMAEEGVGGKMHIKRKKTNYKGN